MERPVWVKIDVANGRLQVNANVPPAVAMLLLEAGKAQVLAQFLQPASSTEATPEVPTATSPTSFNVRRIGAVEP